MIRARFCEIASFSEETLGREYLLSSKASLVRLGEKKGEALRASLAARALLRELLCELPAAENAELEYTAAGRPLIKGAFVSLSHSGKYAAAAVSDKPIGIDIEQLRDIKPRESYMLFCDEECRFVNASEKKRETRFLFCWTRKEAFLKLNGGVLGDAEKLNSLNPPEKNAFITAADGEAVISVCAEEISGVGLKYAGNNGKFGLIFD